MSMNAPSVCIATISLVRRPDEEVLLRSALTRLSQLNLPVFITDGGSPASFVSFLRELPNFTVLAADAKGVFAQARNSLQHAAQRAGEFILYTEPDKLRFFEAGLPRLLNSLGMGTKTGVIMAARSSGGLATFPPFQQMTETAINNCCADRIGRKADYCYGPFLLHKSLVPPLGAVKEDIGWGWRPFVFYTAHCKGLAVEVVEDEFTCPEDQRAEDAGERLYRMKQLEQNIRGLVLAASGE